MYDLCRVAIAFANTDASQLVGVNSIGNLWAEYEVCFDGPKTSELVPSVTFSSALDALTSEEYLLLEMPFLTVDRMGLGLKLILGQEQQMLCMSRICSQPLILASIPEL